MHIYLLFNYAIGVIGCILFVIVVPESPIYHLMKDSSSERGIAIINYISWFNGKKYRVEPGASMEQDRKTIAIEPDTIRLSMTILIRTSFNIDQERGIKQDIIDLMCSKKNARNSYLGMILMSSCSCLYIIGLYNSSQLKGDVLTITLIFGLAEITGVLTSPQLVKAVSLKGAMSGAVILVVIINYSSKHIDMPESILYAIFLVEAYFLGFIWNAFLFAQNQLVEFRLKAISFEFNYSIACTFSMIAPVVS